MEASGLCNTCNSQTLIRDDGTGMLVCGSCGIMQEFDSYDAQIGGVSGPVGTFIRVGTAGSGTVYSYKEKKLWEADRLIDEVMLKLGLSDSKPRDVKSMIENVTEGEFGQGAWFTVLIGACAYIVMRMDGKVLPIADVGSEIGCDVYELGRMISRVVEFLELQLPEFDIVGSFERAIRTCACLENGYRDDLELMRKQGVFILQCAMKWFLTTGRKPAPMVAAVLVFVAKLNDVDVKIEVVAKELNAAIVTCKKRYRELLETLVKVAEALPWGKDINVRNIMRNAPFVIQYLELKSRSKPGGQKKKFLEGIRLDLEDVVSECLKRDVGYGIDSIYEECDSKYFEIENRNEFEKMGVLDLENYKIPHECLSTMYTDFLSNLNNVRSEKEGGVEYGQKRIEYGRKRRGYDEFRTTEEWWSGNSELSRKLMLKQILEKDVGLDAMPPSFVAGCEANKKRREKIKAAKVRIEKVMCPPNNELVEVDQFDSLDSVPAEKKRRISKAGNLDWEDLIIETLLLHQVKEEDIVTGHYNTLLDLYVFNS